MPRPKAGVVEDLRAGLQPKPQLHAKKADPILIAANMLDPIPDPYLHDCKAWVHDFIQFDWDKGEGPTAYQDEIMDAISNGSHQRVSTRGPHGLGKTALASWIILWFANTRDAAGMDWKIPTTASAWRQLDKFLWPEIHKWSRKIKWDKLGRRPFSSRTELMALNLKLRNGQAFAVASDTPELIEGAHADHILYLYDEAKAISSDTFDATEGAFSGAGRDTPTEALALAVSTPGEPNGRFWEIQTRRPGLEDWHVIHVTLAQAIEAGRITEDWADQRRKQWGEKSAVFQNRVLGEFASSDEDGVIPLAWVETAMDRWKVRFNEAATVLTLNEGQPLPPFTCVSADPARGGEDRTVIGLRYYNVLAELRDYSLEDTMQTAARVYGIWRHHAEGPDPIYAVVDVIGIGAGVVDKLREMNVPVFAFNAAEKSEQVDMSEELGFTNMRSAAWWTMRELLDPSNKFDIELPPIDLLVGDLTAPHYRVMAGGRIQVESKEDIRKRIGRSTDFADSAVMSFALPHVDEEVMIGYEDRVTVSPY